MISNQEGIQVLTPVAPFIVDSPAPRRGRRSALHACITAAILFVASGVIASSALAAVSLSATLHAPTHAAPGTSFTYGIDVRNTGDTATSGPLTLVATLPAGLTATTMTGNDWSCTVATLTCTRTSSLASQRNSPLRLGVDVAPDAVDPLVSSVSVSGGGAAASGGDTTITNVSTDPPAFGIFDFGGDLTANPAGQLATQAGSHPYEFSTTIRLNSQPSASGGGLPGPVGQPKTIDLDLPRGLIGDPLATPTRCSREAFADNARCPASSQVGIAHISAAADDDLLVVPVFNMDPPPNVPAQLAMRIGPVAPIFINAQVRSGGDYGLTAHLDRVERNIPLSEATVTLWGVPADPRHDGLRGSCATSGGLCPTDAPPKPFLTLPTDCSSGPMNTTLRTDSWQEPGVFKSDAFSTDPDGAPMEVTGCERLRFDPEISVRPTNTQPDAPSGYEIELRVPQDQNPTGLATAHVKKTVITLPEGVSVSPSAAHGLKACAPSEIALNSARPPSCPDASRIGTVEVDTPLLEEPMEGHAYVAKQDDNPFGSLLAMYLVVEGPGVVVKLAGRIDADPVTGRLTTTLDNNPQLPFSSLRLSLKGGPGAPLANPPTCGNKTAVAELAPWSGTAPVNVSDQFAIACPGMSEFQPLFKAGTTSPTGGAFSPFALRIERRDGDQYINGLTLQMPPGLIAKLKDVPLCSEEHAAVGTCPMETRVGTATVGAGPGPNPFFLSGTVSITGPYKGAPYGLAVAVPAIAGPFNLGMVVVRQAIFVDPVDAHLTIVSDPLPTIIKGIPLRLRSINVDVDRPGFVINPTSCAEKQIRASFSSIGGAVQRSTQRFQVGNCRALPLRPRMRLALTGRRQRSEGRHPGLRALMTQGAGQANLQRVGVKLPLTLALDPDRAQSDDLCEFEDGLRANCPASSVIGRARAVTPVLNRALTGPVHLVKGVRIHPVTGRRIRTLPTLLIPLRGEIAIDLRAKTTVERGKLVTTFDGIPDAPVSRFELSLFGGRRGILVVTNGRNICKGKQKAEVDIDGHNLKRSDRSTTFKTPCKSRASR